MPGASKFCGIAIGEWRKRFSRPDSVRRTSVSSLRRISSTTCADDPAGDRQHLALQVAAQREQRPQQLLVGLQPLEDLGIGDQLGHAVAIEGVLFDDLDRVVREELPHLVQPGDQGELRGVERAVPVVAGRRPRPWYSRP